MEITLLLLIACLLLLGIVVFQQVVMYKMHSEAMDAMAQKAAGIYYPKDLRKQDLMEEKDNSETMDVNDIDDETFKKAIGLGKESTDGQ